MQYRTARRPVKVVEAMTTLPYAQRWIAEEFELPVVPSVQAITPPISYRKPYRRMVTAYRQGPLKPPPPLPFRGFESFGTGGGFFIGAGLLLGYIAYRLLVSSQREQNPALASLRPPMELWANPDEPDLDLDDYEFADVGACEFDIEEPEDIEWEREDVGWLRRWPRTCPWRRRRGRQYRAKMTRH